MEYVQGFECGFEELMEIVILSIDAGCRALGSNKHGTKNFEKPAP